MSTHRDFLDGAGDQGGETGPSVPKSIPVVGAPHKPAVDPLDRFAPDPEIPLNLTDAERGEMREIVSKSGVADLGRNLGGFWEHLHAQRREARGEGEGGTDDGEDDRVLRPGDEGFDPENREHVDAYLKADTEGTVGAEQLDAIGRHTEPFTRKMEALRSEGGDEAVAREVERGEARVLATIYGGREPDMAAGLKTIKEAATLLAGENLVKSIDESQVLADPQSHTALLGMARMLLKRFPDGPPQG